MNRWSTINPVSLAHRIASFIEAISVGLKPVSAPQTKSNFTVGRYPNTAYLSISIEVRNGDSPTPYVIYVKDYGFVTQIDPLRVSHDPLDQNVLGFNSKSDAQEVSWETCTAWRLFYLKQTAGKINNPQ